MTKIDKKEIKEIKPIDQVLNEMELRSRNIKAIKNNSQWLMAVDQAYDGTGFAFYLPVTEARNKKLEVFISKVLASVDPRYELRLPEIFTQIKAAAKNKGGTITLSPMPRKRHSFSLGFLIGDGLGKSWKGTKRGLILYGKVEYKPVDYPEWKQAQEIAETIKFLGESFWELIPTKERKNTNLLIEGMALSGNTKTAAALGWLGGLYQAVWREIVSSPKLFLWGREMPITRWKKFLTGSGRADKKVIEKTLSNIGLENISSDDECDAVSLLIAKMLEPILKEICAKDTKGRMRPTSEQRAEAMIKRKEKAVRKEVRAAKKAENDIIKMAKNIVKKRKESKKDTEVAEDKSKAVLKAENEVIEKANRILELRK